MPVNSTFDAQNFYYSGQGVVMIGGRDINGKPTGLLPLGNVSDLKISVATTVIDHKGSQDGQRSIDKRLQTETKATASVTIDNWNSANLARALRGNETSIASGTVTAETFNGYLGLVSGLQYINISALVLKQGVTTLTAYVDAATPYDYKVNSSAGSVQLNDGSVLATVNLGNPVTGVTVGATTLITVNNTANVGDTVRFSGFTGTNASVLNGVTTTVTAATSTTITVAINTSSDTITTAAGTLAVFPASPVALSAGYTYAQQYLIDGLTQPLTDSFLRFEGLNTLDTNSPVIVELFKFVNDPLKELALISDTFGQFMLEGALLSDPLRTSGSKYFHVKKINS